MFKGKMFLLLLSFSPVEKMMLSCSCHSGLVVAVCEVCVTAVAVVPSSSSNPVFLINMFDNYYHRMCETSYSLKLYHILSDIRTDGYPRVAGKALPRENIRVVVTQ